MQLLPRPSRRGSAAGGPHSQMWLRGCTGREAVWHSARRLGAPTDVAAGLCPLADGGCH